MILPFLIIFSFSSIYSIDLGSQNIRIATSVTGKPVEIKLNDRDHRSTENYLAFPLTEKLEKFEKVNWLIGSDAERIAMVNSSYGVHNPFKLLWTPENLDFNGIHPVTLAATALYQHMKNIKMKNDKLNIIVPTYASPQYRQILHLTAKITGYKSTSILDSTTAIATYYSIERIKKGSRKPITVLFVDIGAENADCSLWKYRPLGEKLFMELLQYRHSGQVGGSYVDRLLLNLIEPQLGRKLVRSERYIVMKAVRKAKEHLVNQTSTTIDFNEDFGKYITLNQSDVKSLTANMTEKIIDLISDMTPPDEIELIGGSSRLQVFIDAITTAFPNIPLRRSLNSDEAAALGGAYFTALRTGAIVGSKIELKKPAIFGLNSLIDDQMVEIYQPGDTIKDKKFTMIGNRTRIVKNYLDLESYDDFVIDSTNFNATNEKFNEFLIQGIEKALKQVKDIMINGSQPVISLKYGLSPELDCFDLVDASLIVNITSKHRGRSTMKDSKVPQKEVKLYLLSIPSDPSFRIPENTSVFLKDMIHADEDRLKMEENCHKLEAFIIETRDAAQYDEEMFKVTTEDERKLIIKNLDEARLDFDCTNLSKEETSDSIERKLRNLRASFTDPIERYEDAVKRPNALIKLYAALDRAEAAKKSAICDNETLDDFIKYLNETYEKLDKMANDKPLDQPSFPVNEIKNREKEILKKIPEVKRPAKKKEVINYSSSNTTDMDDEEYEKLKNVGISVQKPKKTSNKKDIDPEIIKLKEKRIHDLEKEQNSTRGAFNNSRKIFYERKQKFEKQHNLQFDPWKPPSEETSRNLYREYEGYLRRKKEKEDKIRQKKEEIRRKREEERLRIEAEKNRPPTPFLPPEEAERLRKIQEEEERRKREEEENVQRLKNETDLFKQLGSTMYDYDELNGEDEEALFKKYKSLKKKFEFDRYEKFDDEEKRQEYMDERRKYEDLRRRFENDPERKRKEQEKKKLAKQKREERQAKEEEKTVLDLRIEDLETDQRRLVRELELLKQDIQDFDKLEKFIIRKELHDVRKKKRREEREKQRIERRSRSWDQKSHNLLSNSETESESPTSFYDEIPDYSELDYNDVDRYRYDSSSSEDEEEKKKKKKENGIEDTEDIEIEETESSSSSESHEEHERNRKSDFEIEQKEREKQRIRHLIDPDTIKFNYTKDEIREMKKNGFRIPLPKTLYKKRFEEKFVDYEEKYNKQKRAKTKKPLLNTDDFLIRKRVKQYDEMPEDFEL